MFLSTSFSMFMILKSCKFSNLSRLKKLNIISLWKDKWYIFYFSKAGGISACNQLLRLFLTVLVTTGDDSQSDKVYLKSYLEVICSFPWIFYVHSRVPKYFLFSNPKFFLQSEPFVLDKIKLFVNVFLRFAIMSAKISITEIQVYITLQSKLILRVFGRITIALWFFVAPKFVRSK